MSDKCESCGNGGVGGRGEPASLRAPVVGAGLPPVLNNEQDLGEETCKGEAMVCVWYSAEVGELRVLKLLLKADKMGGYSGTR